MSILLRMFVCSIAVLSGSLCAAQSVSTLADRLRPLIESHSSGILSASFSPGLPLSLHDAIRLMIRYSDNTATNLVIDQLGLSTTTEIMQELGFPNTRLHSKVFRGDTSLAPDRSRQFGLGSTTAFEIVELPSRLQARTIASDSSCQSMLDHLLTCDDRTKIAADLPAGIKFAKKTGSVSASRTDAGILYGPSGPLIVCVLTTNNEDRSWQATNAAHTLCARIGRIAFDHFNPTPDLPPGDGPQILKTGSSGELVEMLQRTLNDRLQPSPELLVDGDFGPVTEAALKRFQESRSLTATGIMDADSWKELGPIVAAEDVPEPDFVNSRTLPRDTADPLDGPPVVTARAWAMTDLQDGRILWSDRADDRLDIASTTKIMTAWLVVRLAAHSSEVLEERVTMSARAARTIGSTSGLRAGESLAVREALYGLLLPSGNDMSVALAEHFGGRLADADDNGENADRLDLFVHAMNAEAARLGMTGTEYQNPHGLTSPGHVSTAADLAVLARTALSSDLFRQYVQTQQRGATVQGAAGYSRNVLWKNTNQLLKIEGYSGVKTGTTSRAGACLVSTAERDGRQLLLVVLGSAASESRYADSRNLYRWAWQQLQLAP